jgi:plastocyanin
MRRTGIFVALVTCVGLLVATAATVEVAAKKDPDRGRREVILRDDCDPADPGWLPTGGCNRSEGDVSFAEFNALRTSTLVPSPVGHPAWWFDPSYLEVQAGKQIRVTNDGGRTHTFTEVAAFGGGRVPPLNAGSVPAGTLTQAPACVAPGVVDIPGGGKSVVDGLAPGNHFFQCCIHPWMRTLIKVTDKTE